METVEHTTNKKISRVPLSKNTSAFQKNIPKYINSLTQAAGAIHPVIKRLYEHVLIKRGTVDQLEQDDVIVLVLNPPVKPGGFIKRKSAGTLFDRTVIFMDKNTGFIDMKTPGSWGGLDPVEIEDKLEECGLV